MNTILFASFTLDLETGLKEIAVYLLVLIGLTVVDVVFGVAVALIKREFKWDKLTGYLSSDILPMLGWLVIRLILLIPADFVPWASPITTIVGIGAYTTVFLKILGSILVNLQRVGVIGAKPSV